MTTSTTGCRCLPLSTTAVCRHWQQLSLAAIVNSVFCHFVFFWYIDYNYLLKVILSTITRDGFRYNFINDFWVTDIFCYPILITSVSLFQQTLSLCGISNKKSIIIIASNPSINMLEVSH